MPQFGSGPEDGQGNPGSGFLTQAHYRDILKHAEGLGIRIVPEIVAPSHNAAAIQAMRVRNNDTTLLTDPEQPPDESQSVQVKVLIKELHDPVLFHRKKNMKTQKRLLR